MSNQFGAMDPTHWQLGKTVASILFVKDAEKAIVSGKLTDEQCKKLGGLINKIMSGEAFLSDWLSVDAALRD
jgi:hypothetical protein